MTHYSTSQSALKVTSSADGFGGSVARIEAPGKKGAGGFKLLEGNMVVTCNGERLLCLYTTTMSFTSHDMQALLAMKRFSHYQVKGIYL